MESLKKSPLSDYTSSYPIDSVLLKGIKSIIGLNYFADDLKESYTL